MKTKKTKKRKKRKKRIKRKNRKIYTTHHLIPQSRLRLYNHSKDCPQAELTVELPKVVHSAWHILVDALYGKEIPVFFKELQKMMHQQGRVTEVDIILLREKIKSLNLN